MNIKVIIEDSDTEFKYPCLLIHKNTNRVVLFKERKCGTQLSVTTNNTFDVGYYATDWAMDSFEPFHGSITLEND